MLDISNLTTDRKWRSVLGLTKSKFFKLLFPFKEAHIVVHGKSYEEKLKSCQIQNAKFPNCRALLFFTLFMLKNNNTFDVLGFMFGVDGSTAQRNFTNGLQLLETALAKENLLPKREFENLQEFKQYFAKKEELIIDGTEQIIERPGGKEEQKSCYSGKKKGIESKN